MIPAGKKCVHTPKTSPDPKPQCSSGHPHFRENPVIILGIVLLLIGYFTAISILYTIGGILVLVGVVLWILGAVGRPVGGRNTWY